MGRPATQYPGRMLASSGLDGLSNLPTLMCRLHPVNTVLPAQRPQLHLGRPATPYFRRLPSGPGLDGLSSLPTLM